MTLDLGVLVLVARSEASLEKASIASLPQAPYDSTTSGMQVHPSSEHLASLAECFLSSAATAADPAVRPAKREGMGLAEKSQKGQKQQACHRANLKLGCQQDVCAGRHVPVHCQLCLGTDAGTMACLKHYVSELIVPGYSITTSINVWNKCFKCSGFF